MKKIPNPSRVICGLILLIFGAPFAGAQADTPPWTALRHESDYKQLTPTDKVAFVCVGCRTISPIAARSPEEAANWGKEGASVTCPNCQMITKVIVRASRKDLYAPPVVTYVNIKGEEVAFMVTAADVKPSSKSSRSIEKPASTDSASGVTQSK